MPYFLIENHKRPGDEFEHVGSIDIDLAVDSKKVSEAAYATIVELIKERGYKEALGKDGRPKRYVFLREVELSDKSKEVIEVDFLGPEFGGTGKGHRHQRVQPDLMVRKIPGGDIVFDHCWWHRLAGTLPNGSTNDVELKIADVVACLTMKGFVLGERYAEKDAYDIYSVVSHYKGGFKDVAQEARPYLTSKLIREGMERIADKFKSPKSIGPTWVAEFLEPATEEDRDRVATDAYMRVGEFIKELGLD